MIFIKGLVAIPCVLCLWRRSDLHQLAQFRIEISSFCEPKAQPASVGKRDNDVPTFLILDSEQSLLFFSKLLHAQPGPYTRTAINEGVRNRAGWDEN